MEIKSSTLGSFYGIDGTDSSGKETVANGVFQKLKEDGYNVRKVEYPNYNSPSSALVKMYLKGEFGNNANDVNPYTASSFYAVDRVASYLKEWKDFYEDGGIIIADRYTTSNAVHQASKIENLDERKEFLKWLWDFEFVKLGLPTPKEVFFLNMPIQNSLHLMENRANKITGEEKKDIHESDASFLEKSYKNACWVAEWEDWKTIYCVTENSIDKVNRGELGDLRPIDSIIDEVYNQIIDSLKKKD